MDSLTNQKEVFTYDAMNRLTNWDVYQNNVLTKANSNTYDVSSGNITNRSDLNNLTMTYGAGGRPHALETISGVPENFPTANLSIAYTDFKKVKSIVESYKMS